MLLAIPMVLELSLESVFAVCDVFFVSRLGAEAVATVGLTEALLTLVFAVAIGLSAATTAVVARRTGEGDPEGAAVTTVQAIYLGLGVSVVVGCVGFFGAPRLLRFMGASAQVVEIGTGYTSVLLGGSFTVLLLFLINAAFRGAGDAAIAMRSLWLANAFNLILDPCLIFGLGPFPELGVQGAAVATTIGRGAGVLFQVAVLLRGRGRIAVRRHHLRLDPRVLLRLLRVSAGGILQFLLATASWVGLVRILATFGDAALAGYTIALRIIIFTVLPAWGLSNAAPTLVGQSLGAKDPDRAEEAVWLTARYNMVFLALVSVVFLVFPGALVGIFTGEGEVFRVGVDCLRWVSSCYVFFAVGMVVVQSFNGAGDTMTPSIINLFCYWLLQIPLAVFLAHHTSLGPRGVFLSIAAAELALSVVAVIAFRRGTWKQKQV